MLKALIAAVALGLGPSVNLAMAQNVDSENKTNPQAVDAKPAGMPKDCSKLTGKEKDRCIQATPVGPVDVQTGDQSKGKSGSAKERDRMKSDTQAGAGAPAQSNASVGHPEQKATTGEAQTGTGAQQNNKSQLNSKQVPGQSKDALGHPEARTPTGQGQTGQEPGQTSQSVPGRPAKESTN